MSIQTLTAFGLGCSISFLIATAYFLFRENRNKKQQAQKEASDLNLLAKLKESQLKEYSAWQNQELHKIAEERRRFAEEVQATRSLLKEDEAAIYQRAQELTKQALQQESRLNQIQNQEINQQRKSAQLDEKLSLLADITPEIARKEIYQQEQARLEAELESVYHSEKARRLSQVNHEASELILQALQRVSIPSLSHVTLTQVPLPSPDLKAKLIGKEGRNIRLLEMLTGVTLFLDDTPGFITLSAFHPERRELAKLALLELFTDGKIYPSKIEDAIKIAQKKLTQTTLEAGKRALKSARLVGFQTEVIMQIGAMRLFTTVGQNLLDHSLEVSALMGMLAGEMEKDASLARRIGLLHDIGKTLSDDIGGTHAERGSEFLAKFGESHLVVNGVASHHGQIAPLSFEASLCPIADALSASRLGARIDQNEKLLQRIETLERIAHEFPVERAWAFHGGKELALFVESDKVCDTSLTSLSRKLAERIREELKPNLPLRLIITREKKVIEDVF